MDLRQEIEQVATSLLGRLRRSGGDNATAICPFHSGKNGGPERRPSFSIDLARGVWHCFTCHERGNLYTFLRAMGMDRAVIQAHYGVLLEQLGQRQSRDCTFIAYDPLRPKIRAPDPMMADVVLGLFDRCPTPLLEEGFDEELLRRLDIGFDEKHLRITYPLRDFEGALHGISGRTVVDAYPRYKVYDHEYKAFDLPERLQTNKDIVLWNGHLTYPAQLLSPKPEPIIVVEGFKGCMRMLQYGFLSTVAVLGSYLSDHHVWLLERMGGPVYFMFDNDEAGRRATYRAGLSLRSLPTYVINYPANQPDALTLDQAQEAVDSAVSWRRWVLDEQQKGNLDALRKTRSSARSPSQLSSVGPEGSGWSSAFGRQG